MEILTAIGITIIVVLIYLFFTKLYIKLLIWSKTAPGFFDYTTEYIDSVIKSMNYLRNNAVTTIDKTALSNTYVKTLLLDKIEQYINTWYNEVVFINKHIKIIMKNELKQTLTIGIHAEIHKQYLNGRTINGKLVKDADELMYNFQTDSEFKEALVLNVTSIFASRIDDFLRKFKQEQLTVFKNEIIEEIKKNYGNRLNSSPPSVEVIAEDIKKQVNTNTQIKDFCLFFEPYVNVYTSSGLTNLFLSNITRNLVVSFKYALMDSYKLKWITSGNVYNAAKPVLKYDYGTIVVLDYNVDDKAFRNGSITNDFSFKTVDRYIIDYISESFSNMGIEIRLEYENENKKKNIIIKGGRTLEESSGNFNEMCSKSSVNDIKKSCSSDLSVSRSDGISDPNIEVIKENICRILIESYELYNYSALVGDKTIDNSNIVIYKPEFINNIINGLQTVNTHSPMNSVEYPIFFHNKIASKKKTTTGDYTNEVNDVYIVDQKKNSIGKDLYGKDVKHNYKGRRANFSEDWKRSMTSIAEIVSKEEDLNKAMTKVTASIIQFQDSFKTNFKVDLGNLSRFDRTTSPDLYILFLMGDHCINKNARGLSHIKHLFTEINAPRDFITYVTKYFEDTMISSNVVDSEYVEKFETCSILLYKVMLTIKNYYEKIKIIRNLKYSYIPITEVYAFSSLEYDDHKLHVLLLNMYLNEYLIGTKRAEECLDLSMLDSTPEEISESKRKRNVFNGDKDTITRMAKMRTLGGSFNMEILSIFASDLTTWAFVDKIGQIFSGPVEYEPKKEMVNPMHWWWLWWNDFWGSEKTLSFFWGIPNLVIGKEEFNNDDNSIFKDIKMPEYVYRRKKTSNETKDEDDGKEVTENFIQAIIGIGKAFVQIGTVFTAIVSLISDPVSVILFLIAWVIALMLLIVWFIIGLLGALGGAYIISFVLKWFFFCAIFGIWLSWTIVLILVGIIDAFIGNFILRSLRCENYPNAWYTMHNYHKGNKFSRAILCVLPCLKGYYPWSWVCVKNDRAYPVYAPHQVIFQSYLRNEYIKSTKDKIKFNEKPSYRYYPTMADSERFVFWKESFAKKDKFFEEVDEFYREKEHLVEAACHHLHRKLPDDDPNKEPIMEFCQNIFCNGDVDNSKFCVNANDTTTIEKDNIYTTYIILIIVTTIVYMILLSMKQS